MLYSVGGRWTKTKGTPEKHMLQDVKSFVRFQEDAQDWDEWGRQLAVHGSPGKWPLKLGTCESEIFIQGLVVYVFNEVMMNSDVRILLVPQTILHDRSYSASECVCSCYININS